MVWNITNGVEEISKGGRRWSEGYGCSLPTVHDLFRFIWTAGEGLGPKIVCKIS